MKTQYDDICGCLHFQYIRKHEYNVCGLMKIFHNIRVEYVNLNIYFLVKYTNFSPTKCSFDN